MIPDVQHTYCETVHTEGRVHKHAQSAHCAQVSAPAPHQHSSSAQVAKASKQAVVAND